MEIDIEGPSDTEAKAEERETVKIMTGVTSFSPIYLLLGHSASRSVS